MSTSHIIIHGATGRMGARLCALIADEPRLALHGALVRPGCSRLGEPATRSGPALQSSAQLAPGGDVVIDFSSPDGTKEALKIAISRRIPLLVGTTGLDHAMLEALRDGAAQIGVLIAPNTSLGVSVLAHVVAGAARLLGRGYRASIVEAHHVHKKDAPSGTAKRLAVAARSGGADLPDDQIVAIRGGDVIGEHTVRFAGPGEYVEFTHRATSRDLFVRGAIHAAEWLIGRPAGMHTMEDVLGIPAR